MKTDKVLVIEEFVSVTENKLRIVQDSMKVMLLTDDQQKLFDRGAKIIQSKLDAIKEAESKGEMNKHLKIKKLLGDRYE